ncbi:MAG: hypothetical protein U1F11_06605 [Steroidobacteraceae bacterium]
MPIVTRQILLPEGPGAAVGLGAQWLQRRNGQAAFVAIDARLAQAVIASARRSAARRTARRGPRD